jgi:hypothetical protein
MKINEHLAESARHLELAIAKMGKLRDPKGGRYPARFIPNRTFIWVGKIGDYKNLVKCLLKLRDASKKIEHLDI